MDTYLKRTYHQRLVKVKQKVVEQNKSIFPFWDYRSRRGGSLSVSHSCSSSSGSSSSFDGCSLSSLSSIWSSDAVSINSNMSSSDLEPIMITNDANRLQLHFFVDKHEVSAITELCRVATGWIDQGINIIKVYERENDWQMNQSINQSQQVSRMPSVAVMLFLGEDGQLGYERIQSAKRRFEKPPWKYHHSEHVGNGKINPYPNNSPDYFYSSEELPLWAMRVVHFGKELIRSVLFVSQVSWKYMVQFYKLIIGYAPIICKEDFCLFTMYSGENYDVQFALKMLKGETTPRVLESVKLQFQVPDVGSLVPLLPNVCKPITDNLWETRDHDGNIITIEVTGKLHLKSSTPTDTPNIMSIRSSQSSLSSNASSKSVQSLTSVTSSSTTSSLYSLSNIKSECSDVISEETEEDVPPKLPPRVPNRNNLHSRDVIKKDKQPVLPEQSKQYSEGLRGFYV